jgi:hypothetical protein
MGGDNWTHRALPAVEPHEDGRQLHLMTLGRRVFVHWWVDTEKDLKQSFIRRR